VRAINADGLASQIPARFAFLVAAPIWMRWWFWALIGLVVGLGGYALYRYRVARILFVANMRTRIATDLHDDIGANLTKIAILSEVARQQRGNGNEETDSPLSSIARISRDSVDSMSDIVWAINPQRDSLRDLVRRMRRHAEDIFTTRDIALEFRAPDADEHLKLGVDVRRDLFLIFKEAVNNVARHSRCSSVKIDFRADGSELLLQVSDNGEGFDPAIESEGQGLMSMRRRARTLNGTIEIVSRAGAGTTIRLRVFHIRLHRAL
jgi:signal transduction histidine kinase